MKKLLSTLALSLSAIMATSAMAAPDHRYDDRRHQASATYKHHDKRWDNPRHHAQWEQKRYDQKRVNPSRDWRVGQNFPRGYEEFHAIKSVTVKHVVYPIQVVTNNGTKSMVTMS